MNASDGLTTGRSGEWLGWLADRSIVGFRQPVASAEYHTRQQAVARAGGSLVILSSSTAS